MVWTYEAWAKDCAGDSEIASIASVFGHEELETREDFNGIKNAKRVHKARTPRWCLDGQAVHIGQMIFFSFKERKWRRRRRTKGRKEGEKRNIKKENETMLE